MVARGGAVGIDSDDATAQIGNVNALIRQHGGCGGAKDAGGKQGVGDVEGI